MTTASPAPAHPTPSGTAHPQGDGAASLYGDKTDGATARPELPVSWPRRRSAGQSEPRLDRHPNSARHRYACGTLWPAAVPCSRPLMPL